MSISKVSVLPKVLPLIMWFTLLGVVVAAQQEAPVVKPQPSWTDSLLAITSDCKSLYEGKCDTAGNLMFDCYADSVGTCRCFRKQDATCGATTAGQTCRDNDGGLNRNVPGTVFIKKSGEDTETPYDDWCVSDATVREYYCNSNLADYKNLGCEANERCVRQPGKMQAACVPVTTCTDSDGNDAFTKGVVNWNGQSFNDFCNSDLRVSEQTCQNGVKISYDTACLSGYKCQDGKCVVGSVPVTCPSPNNGQGTGFEGAFCAGDSYCRTGLKCGNYQQSEGCSIGTCSVSTPGRCDAVPPPQDCVTPPPPPPPPPRVWLGLLVLAGGSLIAAGTGFALYGTVGAAVGGLIGVVITFLIIRGLA